MRTTRLISFFILVLACSLHAQAPAHFAQVHGIAFRDKQLVMAGYAMGVHRLVFSAGVGAGTGFDEQYVSPENASNGKVVGEIRESQTVQPEPFPMNSYPEKCTSTYKTQQARLGFTAFFRKNDTLLRHPFTGPHFGVDLIYANTYEMQTVIYKSKSDETRYTFTGSHHFGELGAASHMGWQFALFNEHLYADFRAVLPFYYPFMHEPNLNSPFAGNKWEMQVVLSWHFMKGTDKVDDGGKGKVRDGI